MRKTKRTFDKKQKESQIDLILMDSKNQNQPKLITIQNNLNIPNNGFNSIKFNKDMEKTTNKILQMKPIKDIQNVSIKNNRVKKYLNNETISSKEKRKIEIRKNNCRSKKEKTNRQDILTGKIQNIINNIKDKIEGKDEIFLEQKTRYKNIIKTFNEKKGEEKKNFEINEFNKTNLEEQINYNNIKRAPKYNPSFFYYPQIYSKNKSNGLYSDYKKINPYSKPLIKSNKNLNNNNKFDNKRNLAKTIDNKEKLKKNIISQNKNGFEIDENKKRIRNKDNLNTHKSKKNFENGRVEIFRGNPKKKSEIEKKRNINNGYNLNNPENINEKSIRNKYKKLNLKRIKDGGSKINNENSKKENLIIVNDLEPKKTDNTYEFEINKIDNFSNINKAFDLKKKYENEGKNIINYFNNENNNDNQLEIIDNNKIIDEKNKNDSEQKIDIYNPFENIDYKEAKNSLKDFEQDNNQNILYENNYSDINEIKIDNKVNEKDKDYKNLKDISLEKKEWFLNKDCIINQTLIDKKEIEKANENEKKGIFEIIKEDSYIEEKRKLYGFINRGNNCYINSSLQLLTRIKELKDKILNFNEICTDNNTKGELIIQFKKIFKKIEKDYEPQISPDNLKKIMSNIDEKYLDNKQEDATEFISYFLDGLLEETANKNIPVKKIKIENVNDEKPYERLYDRFFGKIGYSFLFELFYGIKKTQKICEKCKKVNSIKFNSYNMLELSIYDLSKNNKYKTLDLEDILKQYISAYKNKDIQCKYCQQTNWINTNVIVYTIPKYLILSFKRNFNDEYIYNKITYPLNFNFNEFFGVKEKKNNANYILDCVIEHSGGPHSGHYTSLCPIDKKNEIWYHFSDNSWYKSIGYQSDNTIILLYKLN